MRAFSYEERIALDALRLVERADPVPGPHEVVLQMRAASLNFRDLAIARGEYHLHVQPPLVPLSDGAGEVVAVGGAVTRFRVGELACPVYLPSWIDGPVRPEHGLRRLGGPSDGVLAERVCVHEDAAVRAPAHLDPVEAATLPVASVTAWHALYEAERTTPADTVLVLGSGGVSLLALALAHAGGARVLALTRSDRHADALRALGASDVLPCGDRPDWPQEVLARTGGRGVDVVIDVVGGASLTRSIAATRMGGRVHLVGYLRETTATIDTFEAIRRAVTIHVATAGSRESFERAVRALETHRIHLPVAAVLPWTRPHEGFERLATGGRLGKVVLRFP